MEALSKLRGDDREGQDLAFLTGVFSLLEVLLAMPMGGIVDVFSLDRTVAGALLERNGALGAMLVLAEQQVATAGALERVGIDAAAHWQCLVGAYQWVMQVCRDI